MDKCLVCGMPVKRRGRMFCSRACAQRNKSGRLSFTRTCPVCHSPFRRAVSQDGPTCSRECFNSFRKKPPEERFWSQVKKSKGCWLWGGAVTGSGYGLIHMGGSKANGDITTRSAHRFSWELHIGPIPDGMEVLHDCPGGDNPLCVNPGHLWLGTGADNMADKVRKRRHKYGVNHPLAKLDDEDVRFVLGSSLSGAELSRRLKVSESTISLIRRRRTWTHVT
jgi:predicted nucleic acid-binding Zn ribbon protein